MKNLILTFVMALAMFSSAYATAPLRVEVITHKNNQVAVHYEVATEKSKVKIKITNVKSREVMFVETVVHHTIGIKRYDLSLLPVGSYLVEVSSEEDSVAKLVEVK